MDDFVRATNDQFVADELLSVLLIEDDLDTAQMYKDRLELDGYAVAVAQDGESGISMALTFSPDLIYLDLSLPNSLDGFQVLRRLRADRDLADIPVVILTNYSEPVLRECGLRLGALEFLVKAETPPSRLAKETGDWARPRPRPLPHTAPPAWPASLSHY